MSGDGVTHTVESYLEAIFELEEINERVTQARLARWFGVSPPATSEVVRRMERLGLVSFDPDRTIVLSEDGRRRAEHMARRHRIIERYLVDVLGVAWHLADEETRKMEPGCSDTVVERMRGGLKRTDRCPHGNPIPGEDVPRVSSLLGLDACEPGTAVTIDRIFEDLELDLPMLRYLEDHGLLPGRELRVVERDPEGGVTVTVDGATVAVGPVLAARMLCAVE